MARVTLIHWNAAEAAAQVAVLRAAGFDAIHGQKTTVTALRDHGHGLPDAFVIDLGRLPSHGREVALALRQSKATQAIPIVFAGGEVEKVSRLKSVIPEGFYTGWEDIRKTLNRALKSAPAPPRVPAKPARSAAPGSGYSGTPLPKKLGIKQGSRVALVSAPSGFEDTLGELPVGACLHSGLHSPADLVMWFLRSEAQLNDGIGGMTRQLGDSPIWIAWPKLGTGVGTDLRQDKVRKAALAHGLVDYKVCAIDATWSGLLFRARRSGKS